VFDHFPGHGGVDLEERSRRDAKRVAKDFDEDGIVPGQHDGVLGG